MSIDLSEFNEVAQHILMHMIKIFPESSNLSPGVVNEELDEPAIHKSLYKDVVKFLESEGFIRNISPKVEKTTNSTSVSSQYQLTNLGVKELTGVNPLNELKSIIIP